MRVIRTERAPAAIGPYSQAVEANGFLFVSGQIPLTAEGEVVKGGLEEQVHQVFRNVEAILDEAGYRLGHVVKVGLFLTDMGQFSLVNRIYEEYLGEVKPARFTVEVSSLPRGVNVEMEVTACLNKFFSTFFEKWSRIFALYVEIRYIEDFAYEGVNRCGNYRRSASPG